MICPHCKMDINIRNPSGFCDHLQYPEYCKICYDLAKKDGGWQDVCDDTTRLKVPGGWLYKWHNTQPVFIPEK